MIMKKVFNSFFVIIAAMVTFAGCAKQEIDAPATPETKTVQFFANSIETKTAFGTPDGTTYPTLWNVGDKVKVLLNIEQVAGTEKIADVECEADLAESARFEVAFAPNTAPESYTYYAVCPSSAYNAKSSTDGRITVIIPTDQTPLETTVDKDAQIIYAVAPADADQTSVDMDFHHLTAYGKFSLINLTDKITSVSKVKIVAPEGVFISGKWNYLVADRSIKAHDEDLYNYIEINTTRTDNIWFACGPVDLSGQTVKFVVTTDLGDLEKEVTFPGKFESGKIASFKINMDGINPPVQDEEEDVVLTKVTDVSQFTAGVYIIVSEDEKYYLPNFAASQSAKIVANSITKVNSVINLTDDMLWRVKLAESGLIFESDAEAGMYLVATKADNDAIRIQNTSSVVWTATSVENHGVVLQSSMATDRYLSLYSTQDWRYYKSSNIPGSSKNQYANLYKVEMGGNAGGETQEPDQPKTPVLRVTSSEISVEAAGGTGEINYTIENPVDGVSVVASSDVDWITNISPTDDKVTFNVLENTGVERNAVVTLAYDGAEPVNVTVTQERSQSVTLPEGVASIKVLATSTSEEEFAVTLTDAVVTYVSGSNAYIEDAEAGILIYMSAHGLSMGDKLNGEVTGKVKLYNNLREVTSIDYTKATKTSGAAVPVTVLTLEDLNAEGAYDKYENMRIKIEDATVSAQGQISQGDQTYALYFKNSSVTGFDLGNTIDLFGYPSKYNDNIQFNIWENAIIKKVANTTITGVSDFSVEVGGTKEINASASSGENVTYVSANPEIAKVDENGVVTGIAEGETTITVSVPANDVYPAAEETCTVTVTAAQGGDDTNEPITVTKSIKDISGTTTNGTQVLTLKLDDVISATASKGSNNGKVYATGAEWRLYMSDSGTVTVNAISGYTIKTVKFTYSQSNNGTLLSGTSQINSGTAYEVNAQSVTYTVGRTSGTKQGQVKVTAIEVVYQAN